MKLLCLWITTISFIAGLSGGVLLSQPKVNPQDAYDYGMREGVLKGISISYKTFREMFKDKKNRNEYLKRLVAEIQAQKVYEQKVRK